jgi:hypothetical protein
MQEEIKEKMSLMKFIKKGQVDILINLPPPNKSFINNYFTNGLGTKYIGLPYTVLQTVAPAR